MWRFLLLPDSLLDIERNVFPTELLSECSSGLCLFGAGFLGANDAIHMVDADLPTIHVIDRDAEKINLMVDLYPPNVIFTVADVYDWVKKSLLFKYDIVSVDCPTSEFLRCVEWLPRFCERANKFVVLTTNKKWLPIVEGYPNFQGLVVRSASEGTVLAVVGA